jgi:hypothetical protein
MTTSELIAASLKRLGVLAAGETPSANDQADALLRLNDLIDALATEQLSMYTITRTTWTLTTAASYSVGTGGDINIPRPTNASVIETIGYVDSSQSPPLEILFGECLTEAAYAAIPQKSLTSTRPQQWYYNPTFGTAGFGTLIPWPVPTASGLLGVLYAPQPVAEVAITDTLHLPPGYRRMLRDLLAVELAPEFGRQVDPVLQQSAIESKANVKRANIRLVDLLIDPALTTVGPRYSILSDQ